MPDRQQVDAAIPVLREVADGELAAVAGPDDEILERVGDVIERRHAQSRSDVAVGDTFGRFAVRSAHL